MYVAAVAAVAVLFTFLDPDSSWGTSVPVRFLFWFLHAGLGIALAVGVTRVLSGDREDKGCFLSESEVWPGGIVGG